VRSVVWSHTAIDQFEIAIDYLSERNASAALKLADQVVGTIDKLAGRPIGRPGERDNTFEKRVIGTPYLLVYGLAGGPDGELRVHRLFHTAQDWQGWAPNPGEDV